LMEPNLHPEYWLQESLRSVVLLFQPLHYSSGSQKEG
jgi:hypothetical protein